MELIQYAYELRTKYHTFGGCVKAVDHQDAINKIQDRLNWIESSEIVSISLATTYDMSNATTYRFDFGYGFEGRKEA